MVSFVSHLPTLRQRYSTAYGFPIWRGRVSGNFYCRFSRAVCMCVDSSCYELLLEKAEFYSKHK